MLGYFIKASTKEKVAIILCGLVMFFFAIGIPIIAVVTLNITTERNYEYALELSSTSDDYAEIVEAYEKCKNYRDARYQAQEYRFLMMAEERGYVLIF